MSAALLRSKGGLEGWQAKTVDRVRSSAARMGRIIDDLLSYTRTRLGNGIPVERRETDLADIARKMVEELGVAHPGARLEVQAEGDLRGDWDGARLEQVISNVVSNAIDHGEEGETVRVAVRGAGETVEVIVENRGEMPPQIREHAFEAFHRGPEHAGRKASGLGLGLFIAREIVQRHSGTIDVRSQHGCTRVAVRLPRRGEASVAAPGSP
jgi:signal transduction histidine kinase